MTMETSPTITALADALAKAQASVEGATKGKVNPAFKSKYADLASVWEACREALSSNGLSVIQSPGEIADGRMEMTTLLLHASGEWVRGSLTIPLGKVDAHGYGSATTYARRFALAAFVGVAPEDDDGNAAAKAKPAQVSGGSAQPLDELHSENGVASRKSSAQAKRDGDDAKVKADIGKLDKEGLADWLAHFDEYTATLPRSWLDPVRDMLEHRREELFALANPEADEMDERFRQTMGGGHAEGLSGGHSQVAAE